MSTTPTSRRQEVAELGRWETGWRWNGDRDEDAGVDGRMWDGKVEFRTEISMRALLVPILIPSVPAPFVCQRSFHKHDSFLNQALNVPAQLGEGPPGFGLRYIHQWEPFPNQNPRLLFHKAKHHTSRSASISNATTLSSHCFVRCCSDCQVHHCPIVSQNPLILHANHEGLLLSQPLSEPCFD